MASNTCSSLSVTEKAKELHQSLLDGTCPRHTGEPLNAFCSSDNELMCLKCTMQHCGHRLHIFSTMEEGHEVIEKSLSTVKCSKHIEQDATAYCVTDKRAVCQTCCMISCKMHTIREIDDIHHEFKEKFESLCRKLLKERNLSGDIPLKKLKTYEETLVKTEQACVDDINLAYDELLRKIEIQRKEKINELRVASSALKQQLDDMHSCVLQVSELESFRETLLNGPKPDLIKFWASPQREGMDELIDGRLGFGVELLMGKHINKVLSVTTQLEDKDESPIEVEIQSALPPSLCNHPCLYVTKDGNKFITHFFDDPKKDQKWTIQELGQYSWRGTDLSRTGDLIALTADEMSGSNIIRFSLENMRLEKVAKLDMQISSHECVVEIDNNLILVAEGLQLSTDTWSQKCILLDPRTSKQSDFGELPVAGFRAFSFEHRGLSGLLYMATFSDNSFQLWVYNRGIENVPYPNNQWEKLNVEVPGFQPTVPGSIGFRIHSVGRNKLIVEEERNSLKLLDLETNECESLELEPGLNFNCLGFLVPPTHTPEVLYWPSHTADVLYCADYVQKRVYYDSLNIDSSMLAGGRTKQTARISTGGKAPRKQLASSSSIFSPQY